MSGAKASKQLPVENPLWRITFILVSAGAALFFLGEVVLLELALQAALQSNQMYVNIHVINSYLPIFLGTILFGVWMAILLVFASTHPKSVTKNLEVLVIGVFFEYIVLTWVWVQRATLTSYWDYSTIPPIYPIIAALREIPINIYSNILVIFIIISWSTLAWYKWLRPSSWE